MAYVDFSSPRDFGTSAHVEELSQWLVDNQPISLAMNTEGGNMEYARALFERTGLVVYTVGHEGSPALTCQARPQEGEIFGEFPVRRVLGEYTKYPMVVPSPTAAYNSSYTNEFLVAKSAAVAEEFSFLRALPHGTLRGWCATMVGISLTRAAFIGAMGPRLVDLIARFSMACSEHPSGSAQR